MYLERLQNMARRQTVKTLIIGAGEYGFSLVTQSQKTPGLSVTAIHARRPERGVAAFKYAGLPEDAIAVCETKSQAEKALAAGKVVVSSDALMLVQLPIDVVVEATGSPEAATLHADAALANGKHVVMVTKEADIVLGPLFHRRAKAAGLVYTPVDGDQPCLLILGLEILCAGKTSEYDFVYDQAAGLVTSLDRVTDASGFESLWAMGRRDIRELIDARSRALAAIPQHTVPDLVEMGIVANATGLAPDIPEFHAPIARTQEIPEFLVPADMGGILGGANRLDVVNQLRRPDEASFAGGVFLVVRCEDRKSWEVLRAKGHEVRSSGDAAMIYRPSHLLGVESGTTVLTAVLDGMTSGTEDVQPRYDVIGRTTQALPAGTLLAVSGHHHQIAGVEGMLVPARKAEGTNPIPFYMMGDHRLARDVPAGKIITAEMVEKPADSLLWKLRREMESSFALR
jgi:predicted homoserine dehydrogenase-like protein